MENHSAAEGLLSDRRPFNYDLFHFYRDSAELAKRILLSIAKKSLYRPTWLPSLELNKNCNGQRQ